MTAQKVNARARNLDVDRRPSPVELPAGATRSIVASDKPETRLGGADSQTFRILRILITSPIVVILFGVSGSAAAQEKKPWFGETHIHSLWSFDAYLFNTRATPDDAYEFAQGKPLKHSLGTTLQLSRPLDFMAVTDHGVYIAVCAKMADDSHPLSKHPLAANVNHPDLSKRMTTFNAFVGAWANGGKIEGMKTNDVKLEVWDEIIASANRHYKPGKFTTLIAYEYTSTPDLQTLHRNVFFRGDTAPEPFTMVDSVNPEDLWDWMDKIRAEGHEVIAVPHNSNISGGRMFERHDSLEKPLTAEYADKRNRNEPLVEVTQIKGTSETHPILSPNDEFADFELFGSMKASGSYVRDAYRTGLEFQDKGGFNPYRFGLIAGSDSHTCIVPVEENNYSGAVGHDGSPASRLRTGPVSANDLRKWSASGLAGVWAESNTREGIFDALSRKETWGTSGPRITLRFFAGFDFGAVKPGDDDWVDAAYASGVSMGGSLKATGGGFAPTFAFWAVKDPESANLDRIQIVKGWSVDGKSQEKIYDVAWSGDREPDPTTGKIPAVGNSINMETLEVGNTIGEVELQGTWTDPEFNANQNAFYYLRVIEIPTPRWSMYDAKALGIPHPADLSPVIQERAYSSPIWYDHH